jgi:hypothetical protein
LINIPEATLEKIVVQRIEMDVLPAKSVISFNKQQNDGPI